jgi:hypothetical protein
MLTNKVVRIFTFLIILILFLLVFFYVLSNKIIIKIPFWAKSVSASKIFFVNNKKDIAQQQLKSALPRYSFRVGEKLHYGIYLGGLKVGDATITYLGDKEVNGILKSFITMESRATGFYDLEKIYGDIDTATPVKVEREIRLFGENIYITEEYDKNNNEIVITRKSKKTEVTKIKGPAKISNIILFLYHFRYKKDYKIGDRIKFNLPTKSLDMLIDRRIEIGVPLGKFKAFFVKSIPSKFKAWFRDDGDSIPLRLQGVIGFGNTYLALIDAN